MFKKFIRRPVLSIVISLIIVFMGVLSLVKLPVTQFPSISPPKVNITAEYPGANNELLIKSVVIPLERGLNGVPGMKYMTSDAGNDGEASIQIVFDLGTDPNVAAVNVQNRVSSVVNKLPPLVVREGVKITREEPNMLMYINLYSDDPKADQKFLFNYADINVMSELRRVSGVGFADILGTREYAMRIWLKPDRLTAYSISADEVMEALNDQSLEASPGKTGESSGKRSQSFEYVLKYPGRFNNEKDYGNIILKAKPDGESVRLKDVADIEFGSSMYDIYSTLNGKPSAAITVKQSYGSNASDVIKNVKALMKDLEKNNFPKGMHYEISYDVSRFLDASMEKVIHTLFEAFILVAIVVFLFLGDWRSTLIPALAVPVSLVGTFAVMSAFGITLNMISLFALVMAIGVVVDDAIVVIEAVHAKMEEKNLSPLKATEEAMHEISGAIIAITLVMASVFIPIAFMSGPVGVFYRQFSITMASSIILSGVVALTLTPALCALILKNNHGKAKKKTPVTVFLEKFNNLFTKGAGKYEKMLNKTVTKKTITLPLLLAFCACTFFLSNSLPSGFIPAEDQGMIYAIIQTPPGSTLERTNQIARELLRESEDIDGVQSVSSLAGYEILTEGTGSNSGTCLINLKSWEERKESAAEIIEKLEEKAKNIPGANIEFFQPPSVPGYGAAGGFELRLLDKAGSGDYHKMEQVSSDFVKELKKRPELGSAFTFYSASFPQYMLKIDNDLAEQKGVTIAKAMDNLSTLIGSNYETSFIRFDRPYKVIVQAGPQYRALPTDLLKLYVKNDKDQMVPYSDFMRLEKVYGLSEMTRHNMYNSAQVSGTPAPGYSSGQAIKAIQEVADKTLPRGFGIDWAGISKDEVSRGNEAIFIFLVCLGFVYLILSAQYESFILPLPVILSLPVGIFGAFLCLKLLGLENNIYAQVAMVMLIGLLGKNAVLIVEFAVQKKAEEGIPVAKAAIEGAAIRFRPILMTSFAFVAGLIPLVVATGPGAVGNRTIGTAAAGGMLIGTIFGLMIIPGLYYIFGTIAEKSKLAKYEEENPLTEQTEPYKHDGKFED
ncbi:efflux RND transporter permease subunit [Chryseobacterium indologenes]|uniref:Efflux RND transporter permease subunit n=1 Tax=Chryseobacterium indologenes TaxID=253 RepID=A0A3G5YVM2_CHRID|nr:efflux RND transporter permease subunit [Chryseobacterium indologenes]ATN04135.1 hydrophobe/amphiphile efflux-1 family RND transporter [Chryseobacterium indologenes]AYY83200.1 efflux RND transporter permease subunit [Chryseobacterium indologenes]AYZ37027.1 efflux RND transporter permease subunit [Chryseobacterium indologenes]AZB19845.1 efflux RND transporter permease subunit [Chryseobacterium indologenes]MBF6645865.1 efflux RND transporter permease subunit [Chryseobacterium indologenes]